MKLSSQDIFTAATGAAVLLAIIGGLAVIGSPAGIRLQRLDDRRTQDLQAIANAVRFYRQSHNALPDTLRQLREGAPAFNVRLEDVETGAPYEYKIIDSSSYELCATFATRSADTGQSFGTVFSAHPPGRHCFDIRA